MSADTLEALSENVQWRKERKEKCKDPNGWLTLAGSSTIIISPPFPSFPRPFPLRLEIVIK